MFFSSISPHSAPAILAAAVVCYALASIVILWLYARTRLYPLYLLKIFWIAGTVAGFIWIFAMSCADPGPSHGGKVQEFITNPAGPYAALADYPEIFRKIFFTTLWWPVFLFGLLLLWRGFYQKADAEGGRLARIHRIYLILSAALGGILMPAFDAIHADTSSFNIAREISGVAVYAVLCAAWAFSPITFRRRVSGWALVILAYIATVPLIIGLAQFDWSRYVYAAQNYAFAWKTARMGAYVLNSVMVSILAVGVTVLCASLAAYSLTRFEFTGRNAVLYYFIGAMVIPAQLYIVPLFLFIQKWQFNLGSAHFSFMDSRLGLSLIYAAGGLPFAVFLLTGFYRTLPTALGESAAIDGCGEWRMFTDIYFPLSLPGVATAAIFQFLGVWNEYQFALVFLTNEKLKTLPVGLYNLSVSQQYAANWPALFAGVTLLCLPTFLIFVILQERIVAGLTVGAIKQ